MTDDVKMQRLLDLERRVTKLEKKQKDKSKEELDWALNQFRYMEKNSDQSKALMIIERRCSND